MIGPQMLIDEGKALGLNDSKIEDWNRERSRLLSEGATKDLYHLKGLADWRVQLGKWRKCSGARVTDYPKAKP